MRLAPVVLRYHPDTAAALTYARKSSATTHGAAEALECCELLAEVLSNALAGVDKDDVLRTGLARPAMPRVAALASADYLDKPAAQIVGSGYCVASLEAALWCFAHGSDFEETVLMAANLGDDADTTAAIAGQIAGAFYGVEGIPAPWLDRLHMRGEIDRLACALFERAR